jgi:hypothetical protein
LKLARGLNIDFRRRKVRNRAKVEKILIATDKLLSTPRNNLAQRNRIKTKLHQNKLYQEMTKQQAKYEALAVASTVLRNMANDNPAMVAPENEPKVAKELLVLADLLALRADDLKQTMEIEELVKVSFAAR